MSTTMRGLERSVTLSSLRNLQNEQKKISCVALYDAAMANIAEAQGVEAIIVGDSLGMTVQGHDSTLPVTIEQMAYHTAAVRRGNKQSIIIADMPFMTYASPEQMKGSDYDSTTDLYSLGIMLFELCYPMYTGMERNIVLSKLRNHIFPEAWSTKVKPAFPISFIPS